MNSWVIIFLGGTNDTNVVIKGAWPTQEAAIQAAIQTGSPWNWQPCQVWGPYTNVPKGPISPEPVSNGAWMAIASMISPSGGVQPVGYGTFPDVFTAQAWANGQQNPAGYSYGMATV